MPADDPFHHGAWEHNDAIWKVQGKAIRQLVVEPGLRSKTLRSGLLALLLGAMFATSNQGHRYERSKDAIRLEAIALRLEAIVSVDTLAT